MERTTKMSEHEATIQDLQRTVDELRNSVLEAKIAVSLLESYLAKANQQTADWQALAEKAINQIEEWRAICEEWQDRFNRLLGSN
jgi:phage shock protein A